MNGAMKTTSLLLTAALLVERAQPGCYCLHGSGGAKQDTKHPLARGGRVLKHSSGIFKSTVISLPTGKSVVISAPSELYLLLTCLTRSAHALLAADMIS